jgi:hypothetical protein
MLCPKCNNETEVYTIWGDNVFRLRLAKGEKSPGIFIWSGEPIGFGGLFKRPHIITHRCKKCEIQILDEVENKYFDLDR